MGRLAYSPWSDYLVQSLITATRCFDCWSCELLLLFEFVLA